MSRVPLAYRFLIAIGSLLVVVMLLVALNRPEPVEDTIIEEPVIVEPTPVVTPTETTIGQSVEGRMIQSHHFGTGENHLLFVGGIHGGYEWNSVLLAEEMISYLTANPDTVPTSTTVTIIPVLNPDGLHTVLGMTTDFSAAQALVIAPDPVAEGRFNANGIDLNRNFDCKWAPASSWRGAEVSAGTGPFSEPEAAALRDFVLAENPVAVVFWHSRANTVYASECEAGILPGTLTLMNTYANAADYNTVEVFDAYPITGDAEGWLASIGIPAVTVELEGRNSSEWGRNLAGFLATLDLY